jgi:hypothetical protein
VVFGDRVHQCLQRRLFRFTKTLISTHGLATFIFLEGMSNTIQVLALGHVHMVGSLIMCDTKSLFSSSRYARRYNSDKPDRAHCLSLPCSYVQSTSKCQSSHACAHLVRISLHTLSQQHDSQMSEGLRGSFGIVSRA